MKIALYDTWNRKFTQDFIDHWESMGHEVKFNPEWEQAEYADKVFFYQADNQAIEGTKNHHFNGQVYVQAVDIEVWAGQASAVDWTKVDGAIFMAQHLANMVPTPSNVKRAIIQPGIDLDKWTLRPPNDFGGQKRRIAYVVGDNRIWDVKRFDIALQLLRDLLNKTDIDWKLYVRGTYSSHAQYNAYCQHLEKDLGLKDNVIWTPRVDDLNKWLDDKDYLLLPSTKEAFSYVTAQAMAKGIKPVIGNWQSAKETWGEYANETYLDMFYQMVSPEYTPVTYRQFIENRYTLDRYMKDIDSFLGIGG